MSLRLSRHSHLINAVAVTLLAGSTWASTLAWLGGQSPASAAEVGTVKAAADSPPTPPADPNNAGIASLTVGLSALVTLFVNAIVADRKTKADAQTLIESRRIDADSRFAEQQMLLEKTVAQAQVAALSAGLELADRDRQIARLAADLQQARSAPPPAHPSGP